MTPPDPRAPREQQVAAIAYGLKNLARAEGIPVLAVAQLNDEALKRADKRPGSTTCASPRRSSTPPTSW
jgi:replicative DNA helicase